MSSAKISLYVIVCKIVLKKVVFHLMKTIISNATRVNGNTQSKMYNEVDN